MLKKEPAGLNHWPGVWKGYLEPAFHNGFYCVTHKLIDEQDADYASPHSSLAPLHHKNF